MPNTIQTTNNDDKTNFDLVSNALSGKNSFRKIDVNQLVLSDELKKQFREAINANNVTIKNQKNYYLLLKNLLDSNNILLATILASIPDGMETLMSHCLDNFSDKEIVHNTMLLLRYCATYLYPEKNLDDYYTKAYDFENKKINLNGLIDLVNLYYYANKNLSNGFYKLYLKAVAPELTQKKLINKDEFSNDVESFLLGKYHKSLKVTSSVGQQKILNGRTQIINKYLSQYKIEDKYTNICELLSDALYDDGFVKNLNSLKQAMQIFKEINNFQAYAICLALLIEAGQNSYPKIYATNIKISSLEMRNAYNELKELIENGKINNNQISLKLPGDKQNLLKYVELQEQLYVSVQKEIVNENAVEQMGNPPIHNSVHKVNTTVHDGKEYIKKPLNNNPIAQLEAFNNEMYRVFIGDRQPKTKLFHSEKVDFSMSKLEILTEKMQDYKPLSGYSQLELVNLLDDEQIQQDLAEITLSCDIMGENDLHSGNIGTSLIDGKLRLVKIDGDQALFPISFQYKDFPLIKLAAVYNNQSNSETSKLSNKNLYMYECFNIHKDDLESLPLLSPHLLKNNSDIARQHFIPYNWIGYVHEDSIIYKKFNEIRNNDKFKQYKYREILKIILTPEIVYIKIAQHFIHQPELQQLAISEMKKRQKKFTEEALKIPGFQQYLLEHGQSYKNELKTEMINFMEDNKQYFTETDIDIAEENYKDYQVRYTNKAKTNVTIDKEVMNRAKKKDQNFTKDRRDFLNQNSRAADPIMNQITSLVDKLKKPNFLSQIIHNSHKSDIKRSVLEKYKKNLLNSVNMNDIAYQKSALSQAIIETAREKKIKPSQVLDKLYSGVFSHRTSDLLRKQGLFKHDIKPIIKPRDNEIDLQSHKRPSKT